MIALVCRTFRALGLVDGATYIAARLLERLSFGRARLVKYRFVAQPVPAEPLTRPPKEGTVRLYEAGPDDGTVVAAPRPAGVIARRFADGARCFVAAKSGELAGFIWIKEREYLEDEIRCLYRIDPHAAAAWDFDVYVQDRYRASRLFAQLWDFVNAALRERGCRWTLSRISPFNRESMAAHQRLGGRVIGTAVFVQIGAMQASFLSLPPYFHISIREDHYPAVTLAAPHSD